MSLEQVLLLKSHESPSLLIQLPVKSSLYDCLELLRSHNILSCAIYGEAGHWVGAGETQIMTTDGKQYLGMMSVFFVLYFYCFYGVSLVVTPCVTLCRSLTF